MEMQKMMLRSGVLRAITFLLVVLMTAPMFGADAKPISAPKLGYQKPPKVITDILESPALPTVVVSPTHDRMIVINSLRHPSVADLAQPMLRIGGLRINPATNGRHHPTRHVS